MENQPDHPWFYLGLTLKLLPLAWLCLDHSATERWCWWWAGRVPVRPGHLLHQLPLLRPSPPSLCHQKDPWLVRTKDHSPSTLLSCHYISVWGEVAETPPTIMLTRRKHVVSSVMWNLHQHSQVMEFLLSWLVWTFYAPSQNLLNVFM